MSATMEAPAKAPKVKAKKGKGKPAKKGKGKPAKAKAESKPASAALKEFTRHGIPISVRMAAKGAVQNARVTIFGHAASGVQRWCGWKGWSVSEVRGMLNALGLGELIGRGTTGQQVSAGRVFAETKEANGHGEPIKLTADEAKKITALKREEVKE